MQRAKLDLLRKQDQAFAQSLGRTTPSSPPSTITRWPIACNRWCPTCSTWARKPRPRRSSTASTRRSIRKRLYGIQCLRARRLVESGVRFVEVNCPSLAASNGTWDQHGDLKKGHEKNAVVTDQAVAGLLKDLKSRGLLDETLVLWAGEFGRTPHSPGRDGRDHHPRASPSGWPAAASGAATVYGATDEMGMHAVENVCTIHDLHATILHLLGLDHERLTYRFGGRDFRLTDVHGRIVKEVLA